MYEIENWRHDEVTDQTIIELLDRPHQSTQTIPKISG